MYACMYVYAYMPYQCICLVMYIVTWNLDRAAHISLYHFMQFSQLFLNSTVDLLQIYIRLSVKNVQGVFHGSFITFVMPEL